MPRHHRADKKAHLVVGLRALKNEVEHGQYPGSACNLHAEAYRTVNLRNSRRDRGQRLMRGRPPDVRYCR